MGPRPAAAFAVVALLAGCAAGDVADGPGGDGSVVGDVVDPGGDVERALAYDPPDAYELDLEVTCFCPANRFTVSVEDGEVVARTALDDTGQPVDLPAPPAFATSIEDIQRRLREASRGDGAITALELGGDGLPLVVGLDPLPEAVDDEVTYRVLEVRPTG